MKLLIEQVEDAAKMASASDLPNFSKAGTGKTYTALEAFRLSGYPFLIVLCPKIAMKMWFDTAGAYLNAKCQRLHSVSCVIEKTTEVVITTYDLAPKLMADLIAFTKRGKAVLVNDESHYLKTPDAKRTMAIFGQSCDLADGLAARCQQVWNMTGTPITSYANDMFTQAAVLHPEVFGQYKADTYAGFERLFTFKRPKKYSPNSPIVWKVSGNANEAILNRIVYTELGAIRRLEAKGLPPLLERELTVDVKLTREARAAMKGIKNDDDILSALHNKDTALSKVWRAIGLAKVTEVLPYVGELVQNGPVLLGVWHREVGAVYQEELRLMGVVAEQVNGSTPDATRERIRTQFNGGQIDVLIGQMAAMGVSWNIQEACHNVVIAEEHYSPSTVEQFYKRVYRYGQKRSVMVDYITSTTPIDEAIAKIRYKKTKSNIRVNG